MTRRILGLLAAAALVAAGPAAPAAAAQAPQQAVTGNAGAQSTLSVAVSSTFYFHYQYSLYEPGYTSGPVYMTVSGGTAPYTYTWVRTSGVGHAAPVGGGTQWFWHINPINPNILNIAYGDWYCVVRDKNGKTGVSPSIYAHLEIDYGYSAPR